MFIFLLSCKEENEIKSSSFEQDFVKSLSEDKDFTAYLTNVREEEIILFQKLDKLPKVELDNFLETLKSKDIKKINISIEKAGLTEFYNDFTGHKMKFFSLIFKKYNREISQIGNEVKLKDLVTQASKISLKNIESKLKPSNFCDDFCSYSMPISLGTVFGTVAFCSLSNQNDFAGFASCLGAIMPYEAPVIIANFGLCSYCCFSSSNCR